MTTYTVEVQEIPGSEDVVIPIPDEIIQHLGLKEGDNLSVKIEGNSVVLSNTELVLVETIQTYRVRHVVRVPVGQKDWALDTVVCEEAEEFSQKFLDTIIVSHRVIPESELQELYAEDNPGYAAAGCESLITDIR